LVEAETGKHLWAERYDRALADIFAVQDEITEAVTIAVAPAVGNAEVQGAIRKAPESLDAWAAYQRGLWHLSKFSPSDNALAQKFFERTIDLDPVSPGRSSTRPPASKDLIQGIRRACARHLLAGQSQSTVPMPKPVRVSPQCS